MGCFVGEKRGDKPSYKRVIVRIHVFVGFFTLQKMDVEIVHDFQLKGWVKRIHLCTIYRVHEY